MGRHARVVHGVDHVSHEDHIFAAVYHLPYRERPAEHAHIAMHTQNNEIRDTALLHEVVGLRRISDRVALLDLERTDLMRPGAATLALRQIIATAIGVVDGQRPLAFALQAAPLFQGR